MGPAATIPVEQGMKKAHQPTGFESIVEARIILVLINH